MLCGIDLGSRNVKIAMTSAQAIKERQLTEMEFHQFDTVEFYRNYGRKVEEQLVVDFKALGFPEFSAVISTGYGRNTLNLQGAKNIPELKAHTYGATLQTGLENYTLLDLGGQDSKIIKVQKGKMVDFQTNDKCAASSGRYLENMATILGISVEELGTYADNPVDLSSTCAIFGESELIGRIVEGYSIAELAAGINYTIYRRIAPMLSSLVSDTFVFTGGVAKNRALVKILERELGVTVVVPQFPQYNGAIGCLALAADTI